MQRETSPITSQKQAERFCSGSPRQAGGCTCCGCYEFLPASSYSLRRCRHRGRISSTTRHLLRHPPGGSHVHQTNRFLCHHYQAGRHRGCRRCSRRATSPSADSTRPHNHRRLPRVQDADHLSWSARSRSRSGAPAMETATGTSCDHRKCRPSLARKSLQRFRLRQGPSLRDHVIRIALPAPRIRCV